MPWTWGAIVALILVLLLELGWLGWMVPEYGALLVRVVWRPLWAVFQWGLKFVTLFLIWLFFFSQFLLPLKRVEDRIRLTWRVLLNMFNRAGPALVVQDGRILIPQGEIPYSGPGLVITDVASAVAVRAPGQGVRIIPPSSVGFLEPWDCVADVVDLRAVSRIVGPREDEDPFAPRQEGEGEQQYQERQERYYQTRGITRDGVEVVPRLWVRFHLMTSEEPPPSLSCVEERLRWWNDPRWRAFPPFRTIYYGSAESVWRAVVSRPIEVNAPPNLDGFVDCVECAEQYQRYPWDWLPAMMAADLWREYVRRFTLDELFSPLPHHNGQTGLEVIRQAIETRLTQPTYQEMDATGRLNRSEQGERRSEEFAELERRGVRVTKVAVIGLFLPKEVEKELAQLRANSWLQRARGMREWVERQRALAHEQGERAALAFFGQAFAQQRPLLQQVQAFWEGNLRPAPGFLLNAAQAILLQVANLFDRSDFRERLGPREVGRLRRLLALLRQLGNTRDVDVQRRS